MLLQLRSFYQYLFPPPGTTDGEVHDRLCRKYHGKAIVTLWYGPDFTVIRSRGVLMNIPRMVRELQEEILEGSINDGGHLVVGFFTLTSNTLKSTML
ncbi:MAG: hypothetical protein HF970_02840 [ANME-2 cluster archaeon]|nr:hypothetical protein [ANME-2 cluster archaeon]